MSVSLKFQRIAVAVSTIDLNSRKAVAAIASNIMAPKIPSFPLNNGREMPSIGYGTWQAKDEELEKALEAALEAGYRHIDTAYIYENEKVIGKVLKRWFDEGKVKREDIFLVTKLPPGGARPEGVSKYLNKSLENLQMDYVDLYLIHVPVALKDIDGQLLPTKPDGTIDMDTTTDHVAIWKEMEKQVDIGKTRAIGLSNFNKTQIERVLKNCRIRPSALQVEIHPYLQQHELVDFCKQNNIIVTAYSPLGTPGIAAFIATLGQQINLPNILGNPTIKAIAEKHSKTVAQIILCFDIQSGLVPIPKSTNYDRLRQNLDVFDFKLDEEDLKQLKGLDAGIRICDMMILKGQCIATWTAAAQLLCSRDVSFMNERIKRTGSSERMVRLGPHSFVQKVKMSQTFTFVPFSLKIY